MIISKKKVTWERVILRKSYLTNFRFKKMQIQISELNEELDFAQNYQILF